MRQWNRILVPITAVLLLCMLGGGIALGVSGLPRTAPGPVYAAVHWTLWAVLFVGSAVCLAQLRRPAFRDDLRRLRGLLLAAACTSAGVQIIFFAECICQMIGLEISADGMKRYLDSWLFSLDGLVFHLVLMVLILLLAALFSEKELRTGHRILSGILAALLLCTLVRAMARRFPDLRLLAEIVLKAPGYILLWLFLFCGSAVCLVRLRRPGFRENPRRLRGLLLAVACTSAGVRILDFVQNVLELKSSPYSTAEEANHSILYMLFSYQGLLPHLVLMSLIVLAASLLPVPEEA